MPLFFQVNPIIIIPELMLGVALAAEPLLATSHVNTGFELLAC
jgi:hypothetical protein